MAIVATIGANLAHRLGHGPIGALVSAWPALALVGSYELLTMLIRAEHDASDRHAADAAESHVAHLAERDAPLAPSAEGNADDLHQDGSKRSQL